MPLKVEYLPCDDLLTYENNAKIHTAEQIEQIKKSITEFGMNDPIGIWKDNTIIEGHGRLIACKELGIEKVPVIRLDHLTDEERRAYALAHNQLTINTGFDFGLLDAELESLKSFDMSQYGFDVDPIDPFDFAGFNEDAGSDDISFDREEKKKRTCTCPYCGELVEVEE